MVQIKNLPKYVIIAWLIVNLMALPAAAVYDEDISFSTQIKKENNEIGTFGKIEPINNVQINSQNKKISLLNEKINENKINNNFIDNNEKINNDEIIITKKPILLIYFVWLLTIMLFLAFMTRTKKKAILFTVVGVMLSASLVLLTSAYLDRSKDLQNTITNALIPKNLPYISDDIINNAYWNLLWLNLSIVRAGPDVTINFSRAGLLSSINHQQLMDNYRNFIESTYSDLNNINVNLTNFYPNFTISPFNSTFEINGTAMIFYTNDISSLQEISLTVTINQDRAGQISNSTPTDTGSTIITVNGKDMNGLSLFQGNPTTTNLDPTATNSPYQAVFSGSDITITFGTYNGQDGVLRVEANNLEANITEFAITYTSNDNITIITDAQLNITQLNFNKQTNVVLYEG